MEDRICVRQQVVSQKCLRLALQNFSRLKPRFPKSTPSQRRAQSESISPSHCSNIEDDVPAGFCPEDVTCDSSHCRKSSASAYHRCIRTMWDSYVPCLARSAPPCSVDCSCSSATASS